MSTDTLNNIKHDTATNQNQVRVLQLIQSEKEITRADIIHQTGLSAPTITRTIDALLSKNIITQEGLGSSKGGRPPQIIRFNSKKNYVIGIDIGATFIRAALSNLDGEFLYEIHLPTDIDQGFERVMEQIGELIQKLQNRAKAKRDHIFGIGVAVCGIVNKHTGMVDYSPVFNWTNKDVKKALSAYTDLRIAIGNVARLIAQGELLYGIGKTYSHFISINLGYGIGSGIITNGQPLYGADGYAGEFGHIVVDKYSNKKGREKINGTVEALASGYGITEITLEKIKEGRQTILTKVGLKNIDTKKIINAAIKGDELALEVINDASEYIGIGVDTLIKLFNCQAIVVSGGLARNGDFLLEKIRKKVKQLSLPSVATEPKIIPSSFGEDAALMGAFSLILEKVLVLDY